jgi:ATP-dependent exoDNAse (exonuclease V) beta subunit
MSPFSSSSNWSDSRLFSFIGMFHINKNAFLKVFSSSLRSEKPHIHAKEELEEDEEEEDWEKKKEEEDMRLIYVLSYSSPKRKQFFFPFPT